MRIRLIFALVCLCVASRGFQPDDTDSGQIAALTGRFFEAVSRKDLAGAISLCATDSSFFISLREDLRGLFAADRIAHAGARLERTSFPGPDRARSYLEADIAAFDSVTNSPAAGYGQSRQLIDWVKVEGAWRIWRYAPVEAELADAWIAAPDAPERSRLMRISKELLTPALSGYLSRQAAEAAKNGHPQEALRVADLAIEAAATFGDPAALGWAEIRKADILRDQSQYEQAKQPAQAGLDHFLQVKDVRGEAAARQIVGSIHLLAAEYPAASQELDLSLALARQIGDRRIAAAAEGVLGEYQRLHGQLALAMKSFEDSLKQNYETGNWAGEAAELNNEALIRQMWNQLPKALELFTHSLAIDRALRDKLGQAADWGNIGSTQDAIGWSDDAVRSLERSLQLHVETADHHGQAMTLNNLGILLMNQGKLSEALEHHGQGLEVTREFHERQTEAMLLCNRGVALRYLGEFGAARVDVEESLRIEHELEDPIGEAKSRGMLGDLDNDEGRFTQALDSFTRILPVFVERKMPLEEAQTLHNIGAVLQETGKLGEAEKKYLECLGTAQAAWDAPTQVLTLNNLAQLYLAKGDSPTAIEYARKGRGLARLTGSPIGEAMATLALADSLQIAKNGDESRQAYHEALDLAEKAGAPNLIAAAHIGLSSIHSAQREFEPAVTDCEQAIAAVELMRSAVGEPTLQAGFFSQNQKAYHCAINNLLALGRKEDAFRVAERARARALVEIMGRADVNAYRDLSAGDRQTLRKLDTRVAGLDAAVRHAPRQQLLRDLKAAIGARDEFERAAYSKAPRLAVRRGEAEPVSPAGLKSLLRDSHSALIEYVLEDQGAWLFVIRGPKRPRGEPELSVRSLETNRQAIGAIAQNHWNRLRQNGASFPESAELFKLLLKPAYPELAEVTSLGIVPDGNLWQVPFGALRGPDGHYLIESKAIYYAPSLTALRVMQQTGEDRRPALDQRMRHGAPPFLLVGNPWLGPAGEADVPLRGLFKAIPRTAEEVRAIAGIPGVRSRILMDEEATEEAVSREAPSYPIVHLATHAFLSEANPMYSGILLAQPPRSKGDGIWEAREIVERELESNLVTVSACDTGRGEILAGEGVVGMSWALFAAGAESSLLSDWPVSDESTPLLMERFYREWVGGGAGASQRDKAIALQQAQKWMLTKTRFTSPYYWATFVLIGSPR